MALVVGVDSSTQSTKVEARDLATGEVVASGSAKHPPTTPPRSEQDPGDWWSALGSALAALGDHRRDVVAISVAGQQHGLVLVDDQDAVLRPAKLWNDSTSAANAEALVDQLGAEGWAEATGTLPVPAITITKLAWVAEHEPDVLARVAKVMLPHDYLTWRLSGEHVTDRGDASGTSWFDPSSGTYRAELLALAVGDRSGPGVDALPRVLGPAEAAGVVRPDVARDLGLPDGVVVGPGSGDNMGAALGLGLGSGDVAMSLGTSGTVFAVSDTPTHDPSGAVAGFASATGAFLPLVCTLNATKITERMAHWLGVDVVELAALAEAAYTDPGTVALVPYFDGERTPNRPTATGSLVGLTNLTTREQMALAAHDGVLCGLLDGLDALRQVGASVDGRVFLVGGGSRSAAYRQRCADLVGAPVTVPDVDETVATGAAVQAAVVADDRGGGGDLAAVVARWGLGQGREITPAHDGEGIRARYGEARDQGITIAR
jgi:xylulokinase